MKELQQSLLAVQEVISGLDPEAFQVLSKHLGSKIGPDGTEALKELASINDTYANDYETLGSRIDLLVGKNRKLGVEYISVSPDQSTIDKVLCIFVKGEFSITVTESEKSTKLFFKIEHYNAPTDSCENPCEWVEHWPLEDFSVQGLKDLLERLYQRLTQDYIMMQAQVYEEEQDNKVTHYAHTPYGLVSVDDAKGPEAQVWLRFNPRAVLPHAQIVSPINPNRDYSWGDERP